MVFEDESSDDLSSLQISSDDDCMHYQVSGRARVRVRVSDLGILGFGDLVIWFSDLGICSCRFLLALKTKTTMAWRRHQRGSAWSIGCQLSAV
jgi:hypothetical protein